MNLDYIEVDENGKCDWAQVAKGGAEMLRETERLRLQVNALQGDLAEEQERYEKQRKQLVKAFDVCVMIVKEECEDSSAAIDRIRCAQRNDFVSTQTDEIGSAQTSALGTEK